jgi:hypothetical protein
MARQLVVRLALVAVAFGTVGYLGMSVYSQPAATYRQIEPVRRFLRDALAHDSASLAAQADAEQPLRWVWSAVRLDSEAVREWAESRPRVTSRREADTLWVTLRRPGSTERCSPLYPLTAGFVDKGAARRLVHLSSLCPSVSRAVSTSDVAD